MIKYMTEHEQIEFWRRHDRAHRKLNKRYREQFGLGRLPEGACNTLPVDISSTGVDWALKLITK